MMTQETMEAGYGKLMRDIALRKELIYSEYPGMLNTLRCGSSIIVDMMRAAR